MDDIDERFNALTAQIDQDERRKMSKAAAREWARRPRVRRRRRRRIAVVAAVVLVAGAGMFVTYRPDVVDEIRLALAGGLPVVDDGLDLGAVPEESPPVDAKPVDVSPFHGSPAEKYADGAEGLMTPPARAAGGLSRKEVSAALGRAKELLRASHLERGVLAGGRPGKLIGLLDPEQRKWFVKNLDRRGGHGKVEPGSRLWVTSLAPDTAELAVETVKVAGDTRLSAFRDDDHRGVRVKVNYLFVYAIRRPDRPETTMRLVVHSAGTLEVWKEGGRLRFWVTRWNDGAVTPARCDVHDGFVHPSYPDSESDEVAAKATGAPVDPYSREDDSRQEGCRRASRT
ncbi:hypothetical protein ACQPYK_14135 [Streptosporangium sp. CA-135522]|uniref:hypothetical protein n=1 Tax=Streptosporangium sp. CA-135522 TaxID=3240072 RepID=UPI003D92AE53